jgi:hypothetical protein
MTTPLDPSKKLPYAHRGRYQQLNADDESLWDLFITRNPTEYDFCWYDVPLGDIPPDLTTTQPAWLERHIRQTYSKRADVLALKGTRLDVIELKPLAGYVALGQVIVYTQLVEKALPAGYQISGRIITDHADPDIIPIAAQHNIQVTEIT